ncbi:hypothetical protein BDZ85DRAFT_127457 [Elsinoe ampelina]|uniref:Cell wall proline rich protein n=1 Tax=Elsinoe ampelina TaxID=302913 RepID=A0A6A6G9Y7_9PEZI|nr:hypothetical protein BDZ85DRAFT_127457 [Elsinoe ampelina]
MEDSHNGPQFLAPVDYVANPTFSFPAQPSQPPSYGPRRTASLHLNPSTPQRITNLERRSASTLPTFSFNATDTSGRADNSSPQYLSAEIPASASRGHGHRRGASEFVGGSSQYGTPAALVSTSPAKPIDSDESSQDAAAFGSPMRKRGHAHRRSAAVSAHDLQSILQPRDANIVSAQSEETTPSIPEPELSKPQTPSPSSEQPPQLSQARPRVGFSKNIEFIPRPLSTISSEAESIASIPIGQASSSTSPLRPASFSPSTKRKSRSSRSSLSEVESATPSRVSFEMPVPIEREGHLLKNDLERPATESVVPSRTGSNFRDFSFPPKRPKASLDRRSSEPSLSLTLLQKPRRSSVSLREPSQAPKTKRSENDLKPPRVSRKSSAHKVKAWASGLMGRKKSVKRAAMTPDADAEPTTPTTDAATTPASEMELEELFSHDPFSQPEDEQVRDSTFAQKMDMSSLRDFQPSLDPMDTSDSMIDLDAALGPNKTPSRDGRSPGFGARRQLHSSRTNRDFNSPGSIFHRRAESAPVLTPFDYAKSPSPVHSPMADVFEEDEDENSDSTKISGPASAPAFSFPQGPIAEEPAQDDGLGIQDDSNSVPTTPLALYTPSDIPVMEDTIIEESGPIDIVEAHEEPRASTMTKSSDSSDAPTVMADPVLTLAPPQAPFMTTPSTYAGSTFSTPEMNRRQESFDGQRVGTSASSATDCRTLSSFASERPDTRPSVDDVPSLTSSRSTMISSSHPSRRDISEKASTFRMRQVSADQQSERRRKRASIQSLTKLMSGPFGESRNKLSMEQGNASSPNLLTTPDGSSKREHRLSKLMFWKSKGSRLSTASEV